MAKATKKATKKEETTTKVTIKAKPAKKEEKFDPKLIRMCVDVFPPEDEMERFAELARQEEATNVIAGLGQSFCAGVVFPQRIAFITAKKWATGRTLAVAFLGGSSQQQEFTAKTADKLSQFANIKFQWGVQASQSDLRVAYAANEGAYSYLGTDNLGIPKNRKTLNLGWLDEAVVLHEFCHCLSGDTLIDCPRDLVKHPKGIPIKDLVGQTPWVYCWKNGSLSVKKASRVWLSKKSARTVRVKLGTGQGGRKNRAFLPPLELVGTPDHPVLLSDGTTWKLLGDLQPGDRLCSMYRQKNGARSNIRWTGLKTNGSQGVREHVFVCEQVNGLRPEGHDCHHVNENKMDQSVENLQWKPKFNHYSDHATGRKRSEKAKRATAAFWTGRKHSEETLAKMRLSRAQQSPCSDETKAKMSASKKGKPQSAELVEKRMAGVRKFYDAGGRSGMFGKKASEETRRRQSESIKAMHAKKKELINHVVLSVEEGEVQDVYDMTVPGADNFVANGVVVHNSLGAIHEHQHPESAIPWNKNAVYAYYGGPPNNWDQATINSNIFGAYSRESTQFSAYDRTSIMHYSLDGRLLTDPSRAVGWNSVLSASDKDYLGKLYPFATQPPPPVDPTNPENVIEYIAAFNKAGKELRRWK